MPRPSITIIAKDLGEDDFEDLEAVLSHVPKNIDVTFHLHTEGGALKVTDVEHVDNQKNSLTNFKVYNLIRRGFFHLRCSGIRKTACLGIHFCREKLRNALFGKSQRNNRGTNEDTLAALTVIQQDIRNLRCVIEKNARN